MIADQKESAGRRVSAEVLGPDALSPEFVGRQSFDVARRKSCEDEVLRPPTPPPPLPDDTPPPSVPKKEVSLSCSRFLGRLDLLLLLSFYAPCGLQGCKNGPAPFPGRMSYKATKQV